MSSLTNHEIPHLWANQSRPSAKTKNGHLWFDGPTIYSYSTIIGRLILGPDDTPIATLLNTRTYSLTTTAHLSRVRGALRRDLPVFSFDGEPSENHNHNAHQFRNDFDALIRSAAETRHAGRRRKLLAQALAVADSHNRYVSFFAIEVPALVVPDTNDLAAIRQQIENENQRRAEEARLAKERYECENAERLTQWLAGEDVEPPYKLSKIYIRAKGDTLETTRGARVPLSAAILVFKLAAQVRARGEAMPFLGRRIGHYPLDRIDADGTIHAGCHVIEWDEAERLAHELNIDVKEAA